MIYYIDQSTWNSSDYYALFRYINRMTLNRNNSREKEISKLDASRMSNETKNIIKGILVERGVWNEWLEKWDWAKEIELTILPLKEPLILSKKPLGIYSEMSKMNIVI